MSFEQLIQDHRLLAGVLATLGIVSTLLAHSELVHLQLKKPEILRSAGIAEIDWWFRCITGVIRLGFGAPSSLLSTYSRCVFRSLTRALRPVDGPFCRVASRDCHAIGREHPFLADSGRSAGTGSRAANVRFRPEADIPHHAVDRETRPGRLEPDHRRAGVASRTRSRCSSNPPTGSAGIGSRVQLRERAAFVSEG